MFIARQRHQFADRLEARQDGVEVRRQPGDAVAFPRGGEFALGNAELIRQLALSDLRLGGLGGS
jgi:hypothetical protein